MNAKVVPHGCLLHDSMEMLRRDLPSMCFRRCCGFGAFFSDPSRSPPPPSPSTPSSPPPTLAAWSSPDLQAMHRRWMEIVVGEEGVEREGMEPARGWQRSLRQGWGRGGLVTGRQSERARRCGSGDGGESEGWRDGGERREG